MRSSGRTPECVVVEGGILFEAIVTLRQAHILTAGGVPPILHVLRNEQRDSEFLKKVRPPAKCPAHCPPRGTLRAARLPTLEGLVAHHSSPCCQALSMLWNLSISANGISSVVHHEGVAVVLQAESSLHFLPFCSCLILLPSLMCSFLGE